MKFNEIMAEVIGVQHTLPRDLPRVYVCHPLRGPEPYSRERTKANQAAATEICRRIFEAKVAIPFSPLHAFSFLDPLSATPHNNVMAMCFQLLEMCEEVWVYGEWASSKGCLEEIKLATKLHLPVKFKN